MLQCGNNDNIVCVTLNMYLQLNKQQQVLPGMGNWDFKHRFLKLFKNKLILHINILIALGVIGITNM